MPIRAQSCCCPYILMHAYDTPDLVVLPVVAGLTKIPDLAVLPMVGTDAANLSFMFV